MISLCASCGSPLLPSYVGLGPSFRVRFPLPSGSACICSSALTSRLGGRRLHLYRHIRLVALQVPKLGLCTRLLTKAERPIQARRHRVASRAFFLSVSLTCARRFRPGLVHLFRRRSCVTLLCLISLPLGIHDEGILRFPDLSVRLLCGFNMVAEGIPDPAEGAHLLDGRIFYSILHFFIQHGHFTKRGSPDYLTSNNFYAIRTGNRGFAGLVGESRSSGS